jgi:hypothetical protein
MATLAGPHPFSVQTDNSVPSLLPIVGILALFGMGAFIMTFTAVFLFDLFHEIEEMEED